MRVIDADKFEKNSTNICVFCIILGKFGYWQEFNLVVLLEINKNLEINFYDIFLLINLAISIKIKNC